LVVLGGRMKDNFLLKKSQREVFDALSDEEAGILIKGVFKYLDTGNSELNGTLKAIFIPIKNDIDKNEENYQKVCERNRENIKKRWDKVYENIPVDTTVYESIPVDTKVYQSIPEDTDARHISYITNHLEEINNKKDIRGMGEEEKEERRETFKQVIDYLNEKTNSSFKYTTKATQQKINARLNEGYKLDDFIDVIDKKFAEWKGTEFEIYLRPDTLFGTKFEGYLNQKANTRKITTKDIATKVDIANFFGGRK